VNGGLGFGADKAGPIYAMYTSLVYLATVPGGWLADNFLGQRRSVLYGGVVIMLGHISLALHGLGFFYAGLGLVVIGTGLLKPNISVIVGQLYGPEDQRRDSGFSIFYMGINLGAFAAPLVCGWLAQGDTFKAMLEGWGLDPINSWHWGFAAAAVGMFFGLLQYVATSGHLGQAGLYPAKPASPQVAANNRRTLGIGVALSAVAVAALLFIDSRAVYFGSVQWQSGEGGITLAGQAKDGVGESVSLNGGGPVAAGKVNRYLGEEAAGKVRLAVMLEELAAGQAGGSMTDAFVPVEVPDSTATSQGAEPATRTVRLRDVSWGAVDGKLRVVGVPVDEAQGELVLAQLGPDELRHAYGKEAAQPTDAELLPSVLDGGLSQLKDPMIGQIFAHAVEGGRAAGSLQGLSVKVGGLNAYNIKDGFAIVLLVIVIAFFAKLFLIGEWTRSERARLVTIFVLFCGAAIFWGIFEQAGSTLTLFAERSTNNSILGFGFPSSFWQSLNAILIVLLAPLFAWLWIRLGKRNPSYPAKFAVGIFFAGLGFAVLVGGATMAKNGVLVSPWWLFAVYLLHTVGELCLSPVGLSSMTKLAPTRVVSLMMGVWFLAASVGNFIGGSVSGFYEDFELPSLFGVVAITGGVMALVMFALVIPMRNMMKASEGKD
jgi:dipeptide/tripeptide permease